MKHFCYLVAALLLSTTAHAATIYQSTSAEVTTTVEFYDDLTSQVIIEERVEPLLGTHRLTHEDDGSWTFQLATVGVAGGSSGVSGCEAFGYLSTDCYSPQNYGVGHLLLRGTYENIEAPVTLQDSVVSQNYSAYRLVSDRIGRETLPGQTVDFGLDVSGATPTISTQNIITDDVNIPLIIVNLGPNWGFGTQWGNYEFRGSEFQLNAEFELFIPPTPAVPEPSALMLAGLTLGLVAIRTK